MCKIVAFTSMKNINVEQAANAIGNTLLREEPDGFGYAIRGKSGTFGEKCVQEFFESRIRKTSELVKIPVTEPTYKVFGKYSVRKDLGAGIFHGRTSTNEDGLKNTHPMHRSGWNLIHNGVVTDYGVPYLKNTDNDSEDVLYRLLEGGIHNVAGSLTGYYAFAAIDPKGRLHVAKDRTAELCIAWSESHKTYVIATNEETLSKVSKKLKLKVGPIDLWRDDFYAIFKDNRLVSSEEFYSQGYGSREAAFAGQSLGRSLGSEFPSTGYPASDSSVYDASSFKHYDAGMPPRDETEARKQRGSALRAELNSLNSEYRIYGRSGFEISLSEFHQLDAISQLECEIERPDGTMLDLTELSLEDVS